MFVPLKNLIHIALNSKGIEKEASAAHVCEIFRKFAAELVHPEALDHVYPRYFRRGVLVVGVDHSAWIQLINEKKPLLITKLRSHVRGIKIIDIRSVVSTPKESESAPIENPN